MSTQFRQYLDVLVLFVIGAVIVAVPQLDLAIAGFFYDPVDGFYLRTNPLVRFVYEAVPWVTRTVVISLLLFVLAAWTLWRHRDYCMRQRRAALYLLLVMIIGPGLLVNTLFKDQWGRARPSQIEQFGGEKIFTRAAIPTDQCQKNCSFVSGHASVGFFFLALAYVWPRRRILWLVVGTGLGLGIGLIRMIQGGHFFSDVIFCGIVVYLTARFLHALMFRNTQETCA